MNRISTERPPSPYLPVPPFESSQWDSHPRKATELASGSTNRRPTETIRGVPPHDPAPGTGAEYETSTGVEDGREPGRTSPGAQIMYEFDGGVRLAGGPPGRTGEPVDVRGLAMAWQPPPYQCFD